jgi:hypothetical protein
MVNVLIGCPIYKRDWIFPYWISCIENQELDFSKIGFVFETSPDDEETIFMLTKYRNARPSIEVFEIDVRNEITHFNHQENSRSWSMSKYLNMVFLRNKMLEKVREINPDYFFSLDSDVLLTNSNTINYLVSHIQDGADAVSPLMFMTPNDTLYPSVMNWIDKPGGQGYRKERYPLGEYFKSDIIMAAKMMSKTTYQTINYELHSQGEDLGWCANAAKAGLSLFSASYIYAPHIMHRAMLNRFLREGDLRGSEHLKMS